MEKPVLFSPPPHSADRKLVIYQLPVSRETWATEQKSGHTEIFIVFVRPYNIIEFTFDAFSQATGTYGGGIFSDIRLVFKKVLIH